jgi:hypothetical protein
MGWECGTYRDNINAHRSLVGYLEGKRPPGRPEDLG